MLKNKMFKRAFRAVTGLSTLGLAAHAAQAAPQKPNVLVILADDMGWSDIASYGGDVPTPNLDKLAAEGVRFTQFYNTARCSPSRASLMTGLYPHEAGMGYLDNLVKPDSEGTSGRLSNRAVTIAEALKPAGYLTAMTGKWHMGQKHGTPPWQRGFDHSFNSPAGGIYFANQQGLKNSFLYDDGKPVAVDSPTLGKDWYSSDLWTKYSLGYIDEAVKEKKPFFVYQAFCAVHFPLMAPEKDMAKYRGKFMQGWDKMRETRYQRQIKMGLIDPKWPLAPRPAGCPAWDSVSLADKKMFDEKMSVYAAMIDNMDQNVGKLVAGLKQRGVLDNTLILFLSDNGGNAESGPTGTTEGDHLGDANSRVFLGANWATLSNTPFRRYKHFTHEGGISTPLIAHWPQGIPASRDGKLEKQPGHLVDIMATVMDITGSKYPTTYKGNKILPMDGVSLVPAFKGQPLKRTKPIFWEHEGNRAIRDGKWKLVSKYKSPWELYDIEADRTEQKDLAKANPALVAKMSAQWDTWAKNDFVDQWTGPARNDWGGLKKGGGGGAESEDDETVGKKAAAEAKIFNLKAGDTLTKGQVPNIVNHAITITATLGAKHDSGVIVAQGGLKQGYALYILDGKLELATRIKGEQTFVTASEGLPDGPVTVTGMLIKGGTYKLQINGKEVASKQAPSLPTAMPVDGLQVGRDAAGLVGRYSQENAFQGEIQSVKIEIGD